MKRNVIETIMGAVVIIIAAGFVYTTAKSRNMNSVADGYQISALFDNISGITAGSDVRMGGVKVGTVNFVELDTKSYRAKMAMTLQKDIPLPSDSSASIIGDGLLGGKFVSLEAGGADELVVAGGSLEFTQSSVSLEQLIGKFVFSGGGVDDSAEAAEDDDVELSLP